MSGEVREGTFSQEDLCEQRAWRKGGARGISKRRQEAGLTRRNGGEEEGRRMNEAPHTRDGEKLEGADGTGSSLPSSRCRVSLVVQAAVKTGSIESAWCPFHSHGHTRYRITRPAGQDKDGQVYRGEQKVARWRPRAWDTVAVIRALRRKRWLCWVDGSPTLSKPVQPTARHFPVRVLRVLAARPAKTGRGLPRAPRGRMARSSHGSGSEQSC